MAEQIARWRAIAELDARHGTPVGDALREAAAEVERLGGELAEVEHVLKVTGEKADALRGQRDRLAEQVKRIRDRHPRETDDADCPNADTTFGCQHGPGYHTVEYCTACDEEWPCAEIAALDGTEAGR